MIYAKVKNGTVIKYPYTMLDLKSENPNTSFPSFIADYILREYDIHKVNVVRNPSNYLKNYSETEPVFINNELFQSWVESDATESEIADRINSQWTSVRSSRDKMLKASDWTQLPDVALSADKQREWAEYRQELRDITDATNPFLIEFPEEPTNV
jgi:hypothetical protein